MATRHTPAGRARGFTLVELVGILILVGILAAVAVPRLVETAPYQQAAWRDQVQARLRFAVHTAVAHRRLVCISLTGQAVTLSIAATNPATACTTALAGPDGQTTLSAPGSSSLAATPAGTLHVQPDGRVTTDGAGTSPATWSLTLGGASPLTLVGETGLVY